MGLPGCFRVSRDFAVGEVGLVVALCFIACTVPVGAGEHVQMCMQVFDLIPIQKIGAERSGQMCAPGLCAQARHSHELRVSEVATGGKAL